MTKIYFQPLDGEDRGGKEFDIVDINFYDDVLQLSFSNKHNRDEFIAYVNGHKWPCKEWSIRTHTFDTITLTTEQQWRQYTCAPNQNIAVGSGGIQGRHGFESEYKATLCIPVLEGYFNTNGIDIDMTLEQLKTLRDRLDSAISTLEGNDE